MVADMLKMLKLVDMKLREKMPLLQPHLILVGSVAEGTVVLKVKDIDITMQFCGLESAPLYPCENGFSLRLSDANNSANPLAPFQEEGQLKMDQFFKYVIESIGSIIKLESATINDISHSRLKVEWPSSCHSRGHECPFIVDNECQGKYYSHCKKCSFPVTQTKCGACLIFAWKLADESRGWRRRIHEEVITVDIIPVLPLAWPSLNDIFGIVTRTLVTDRPANWLDHMLKFMKQDRLLPEHYERMHEKFERFFYVGIKLLNYGESKNFVIRPGQKFQIEKFFADKENGKELSELALTFCRIKAIRKILGVKVSPYFIKKVILTDDIRSKISAQNCCCENIYNVLEHPDLKFAFKHMIDYDKWKKCHKKIPIRRDKVTSILNPLHWL